MKRTRTCLIALAFLPSVFLLQSTARANGFADVSSMRCEGRIIDVGTAKYEVQNKCGIPSSQEQLAYGNELWIYNFGSTQLVYYMTFRGIRLSRIQTGGYGK